MKRLILLVLGISSTTLMMAQTELSTFTATGRGGATTFATDYQALGINPANLGWTWKFEDKTVAMGMFEGTYSIHAAALEKDETRTAIKDMFNSIIGKDSGEPFTREEKEQLATDFVDQGFAMNFDVGVFGIAYTNEKFGGIAFGINDRFQWYSSFNQTVSDLIFNGFQAAYFDSLSVLTPMGDTTVIANDGTVDIDPDSILLGFTNSPQMFSEIFAGSEIGFSWTREYNLSYGRRLFGLDSTFALYGGFGAKYIQGMGMINASSDGTTLTAFSAISPFFDIDYGSAAQSNPSALPPNDAFPPQSVGRGWGFDIGLNAVVGSNLKLGAAITNIGSVTWDGNVYTAMDTLLYDTESGGMSSWDVKDQLEGLVGEDGLFQWGGETQMEVKLPTTMRVGASLRIGQKVELGVDVLAPFNEEPGNYEKAVIGFGGDFQPLPWIRLSGGFVTGGNYKFQIPVGVLFITNGGTFEAGIASRDAISFFVNNGPTLSLSMGFARFRF